MLSIPFTTKQRWADEPRASIDNSNLKPRVTRDPATNATVQQIGNSSMTPHEKALVTVLLERLKKTVALTRTPKPRR